MSDLPVVADNSAFPIVPVELDGHDGTNRLSGQSIIGAANDREAIALWITVRGTSEHTKSSYIREADRFYRWATLLMGKPISSLTPEDLVRYRRFLDAPLPDWVGQRKLKRSDPGWRPFTGPLSQASAKQAMTILKGLFQYLVEARYLAANAFSLARREKVRRTNPTKRVISNELQRHIRNAIEAMPRETRLDLWHYHRCRWVVALLGGTGLRTTEAISATMGAIFNDGGFWFVNVIGKGEKERDVPLPSGLISEMMTYRHSLGLPDFPVEGESVPLVAGQNGKPIGRQHLYRIIKQINAMTAEKLMIEHPEIDLTSLRKASTHWLRHGYVTNSLDAGVDMRTVRDNVGHSSIATTSRYSHRDRQERAKDMEKMATRN